MWLIELHKFLYLEKSVNLLNTIVCDPSTAGGCNNIPSTIVRQSEGCPAYTTSKMECIHLSTTVPVVSTASAHNGRPTNHCSRCEQAVIGTSELYHKHIIIRRLGDLFSRGH